MASRASVQRSATARFGLFLGASFQTVIDVLGPIPGQYLLYLGLVMAFHYLDLLGAPFFRRFAEFRSNRMRIDQFLSQALLGECERRNKGEVNGSHAYLPSKKSRAHIEAFRHDTGRANHDLQFSASSRAGFKVLTQPPYDDCELAHKDDDLHSTNALPDPVTGLSCHRRCAKDCAT